MNDNFIPGLKPVYTTEEYKIVKTGDRYIKIILEPTYEFIPLQGQWITPPFEQLEQVATEVIN